MEAQDIQFSAEMSVSRRGSLDCSEIARTLASRNGNQIYVTGGELRADDAAAFGKGAIDFIQQFSVDYAILSVGAINSSNEFLDFHLCEAEFSRAAIKQARESCFVADSSKFDSDALIKVCGLDDVVHPDDVRLHRFVR